MKLSPVQPPLMLEGYYVTELSFKVRDLGDEPTINMHGGIGVQHGGLFVPEPLTVDVRAGATPHPDTTLRWQCSLRVTSNMPPERKYPYDFNIILVGYFSIAEVVPEEQRELYIKVSAASILYSAAREALATATGRGPLPCVVLPPVVFAPNPEEQQTKPASKSLAGGGGKSKKPGKKGGSKNARIKKQQR